MIITAYVAMLGGQLTFFIFAFSTFWKFASKCLKDNLASEKYGLVLVYFLILLSIGLQILFFFGEINQLYCPTPTVRLVNSIGAFIWDLPITYGVCWLHQRNFRMPRVNEYPSAAFPRRNSSVTTDPNSKSARDSRQLPDMDPRLSNSELDKSYGDLEASMVESETSDAKMLTWRLLEVQNGFRMGEFGHLIQAYISKRNYEDFMEDEKDGFF